MDSAQREAEWRVGLDGAGRGGSTVWVYRASFVKAVEGRISDAHVDNGERFAGSHEHSAASPAAAIAHGSCPQRGSLARSLPTEVHWLLLVRSVATRTVLFICSRVRQPLEIPQDERASCGHTQRPDTFAIGASIARGGELRACNRARLRVALRASPHGVWLNNTAWR